VLLGQFVVTRQLKVPSSVHLSLKTSAVEGAGAGACERVGRDEVLGTCVGRSLAGSWVGAGVGFSLGAGEGIWVGGSVSVGPTDPEGSSVGEREGRGVGHVVGIRWSVGETVGRIDGICVGALVTIRVGGFVFFASAPPISTNSVKNSRPARNIRARPGVARGVSECMQEIFRGANE
jgi:hypothetical protein